SDPVDIRTFTLTAPNRVVLDMPEVLWRVADEDRPSGKGLVGSYRYGLFRKGESRFVIDLNQPVRVEKPQLLPPQGGMSFRLAVEFSPASLEAFAANAGWPKDPPTAVVSAAPAPAATASANRRRIIVLDAGHGGIDPGTHGASGVQEKNVVLAVAKKLRDVLE